MKHRNEHCRGKRGVWERESDKRLYENMGVGSPRKASRRGMGRETEDSRKNKKDQQDT